MNFHFRSQSDSSDSGIIRYSDEQQSLERLFSPPSEDFIPLRDRNLPPSFFNPTANRTNDNQTSFHARSTSHFEQKPKQNGIHMRTQSVLAPMSSYISTSNGSDGISNYTASSANSSLIDNNNSNNSSVQQLNGSNNDSVNNLTTNIPQTLNNSSHNNNNNDHQQHHHHNHQQLHYRNYSSPAYVRVDSGNFLPNHRHQQQQPPPPPPPIPQTPTLASRQTAVVGRPDQQMDINQIPPQETFHQRNFSLPAPLEHEILTAVDPINQSDQLYWDTSQDPLSISQIDTTTPTNPNIYYNNETNASPYAIMTDQGFNQTIETVGCQINSPSSQAYYPDGGSEL